ncbi:MAG: mevalonate kinase [Myxococcota bacterium]
MPIGRAPGKVILVGEHFVVHGAPAIAVPLLARGVEVEVLREPGGWDVPDPVRPFVEEMAAALGEAVAALTVSVRSDLPMGAGLGGSAALATALARALHPEDDDEHIRRHAHELEKIAHGRPSGIDDAVTSFRRPVLFEPGGSPRVLEGAPTPPVWVGVTAERTSTKEAVAGVAARARKRPAWFAERMDRARDVARRAEEALLAGDWPALGAAMDDNHTLLREVGVSTDGLDALVASAREAGAWGAKLTGGGLGGAAIALAPPDLDLEKTWRSAGAVEVIAP